MLINKIFPCEAQEVYSQWKTPTTIISDGAYGIKGFPGDPRTPELLPEWYEPHIKAWTEAAAVNTSLWFWNTEVGWATIHPYLIAAGWKYVQLITWDKGIGQIAGNVNSKTIRQLPVVTEVSGLYVRPQVFTSSGGKELSLQDWLRTEWKRTGLPFSEANKACGVANAATRKWLTADHLWYQPPHEAFIALKAYADKHGNPAGAPYFENGPATSMGSWTNLRSIWNHAHGLSNVWNIPSLRGKERLKGIQGETLHANQKPIELMRRQIEATSHAGDTIWEPFGGLASASAAAKELNRNSYAAEPNPLFYEAANARLA